MGYTYQTFGDLKTLLSGQLGDPLKVYWTNAELSIYLNAAFREWNSISRMFRDRGSFPTSLTATFYDLRDVLQNGVGEFFLTPTITDSQLLTQAKYMLVEPNPSDDTTFTDGFTAVDFADSFEQCRNQFLLETGLLISQTFQVVGAGDGRVSFADDSIIDIRRATWTTLDNATTTLFREDEFSSFAFSPDWPQNSGTPERYSIYPDPLLTLQLIPPPVDNGTLTIQTISSGVMLDDFTPTILWGVLSNKLSSPGPGNDPMRSQYAAQRWKEGLVVGAQAATVLQSYINGVPVPTESTFDSDVFSPSWTTPGIPESVTMLGSNLIAVSPRANDIYSVTLDCVRNAPQFTNDASFTPIGREYIKTIVDYAAHLASFKLGGTEFQSTFPDYDAFVKSAIAYNNRMYSQNLNFPTLIDRAMEQEKQLALRKAQE